MVKDVPTTLWDMQQTCGDPLRLATDGGIPRMVHIYIGVQANIVTGHTCPKLKGVSGAENLLRSNETMAITSSTVYDPPKKACSSWKIRRVV